MNQQHLFDIVPVEKAAELSKEDLLILWQGEQKMRQHFQKENERLIKERDKAEQKSFMVEDQLVIVKNRLFGKSSERSPKEKGKNSLKDPKSKKRKVQLPSLRYPNAPLLEKEIELAELPDCKSCGKKMEDSGMTEDSEQLTVKPREFIVVRYKRHKYRCSCCHGDLVTAPSLPKIKEGSSYSDDMIIDVALSKYCKTSKFPVCSNI